MNVYWFIDAFDHFLAWEISTIFSLLYISQSHFHDSLIIKKRLSISEVGTHSVKQPIFEEYS